MALWLDGHNVNADSVPDTITNGSPFYLWSDSSGNNRNAIQGTPSKAARYQKDSANLLGKGFVALDLPSSTLDIPPVSGAKTVFAVFRQGGANAQTKIFYGLNIKIYMHIIITRYLKKFDRPNLFQKLSKEL